MLHADNNDTADNLKKGVLYRSDGSGTNYAVSLENHGYGTIEVMHFLPAFKSHFSSYSNPKMGAQRMFIDH